jgi:NAD(P)-dependent dehydrogenase (short-subunit alcohol dehydrogenase family)
LFARRRARILGGMTQNPPRVWLISGTSAGFGRSLAETALDHGDMVVATARQPGRLDDLVQRAPDRVLAQELDVTRPGDAATAVAAAIARFGRLDVVVNNAGYGSVGAVEEIDLADLRTLMDTMFFGAVELTQAALPQMRAQGTGAIVQISSMGGQCTAPGFGAYCAAKFALEGLSESLAAELGPLGIVVMLVEPGAFRTEFGGARMHRSREIAAYAETVGPTRAGIDAMDGTQPGDPRKAAEAIITALDSARPPLHLALGEDALEFIGQAQAARRHDLEAWSDLSRSTSLEPVLS